MQKLGWGAVCVLLFPGVLGGCVSARSKQLTTAFGANAATLASSLEEALPAVRTAELEHNQSKALASNTIGFDSATKPEISAEEVALRIEVLDQLHAYASGLQVLMSDAEKEQIRKASANLYDALGTLNSRLPAGTKASDEDLKVVSTAVYAIGSTYFEYRRFEYVKEIVSKAQPIIEGAVDGVLKPELEDWKKSKQDALADTARNYFGIAQRGNGFIGSIPRIEVIAERQELLTRAVQYKNEADGAETEFDKIAKSLDALRDAHAKLNASLQTTGFLSEGSVSRFSEASEAVKELSARLSEIKAFYEALGVKSAQGKK